MLQGNREHIINRQRGLEASTESGLIFSELTPPPGLSQDPWQAQCRNMDSNKPLTSMHNGYWLIRLISGMLFISRDSAMLNIYLGRRKQKWAVDPRNTAWSNDDSKFGQRMLEKMGWSKGKGLGAQEQGATDHIKVKVKNNHLGLGATINNEDNWIAHQDDFNQLLAELNTCHGQEIADSSDNKEKKSFNLEEKSKISKNRVHYMKFAKGWSQPLHCRRERALHDDHQRLHHPGVLCPPDGPAPEQATAPSSPAWPLGDPGGTEKQKEKTQRGGRQP
ncbi:PIN2/TERF1-interacting telomerase inhibitor 1 isoform X9 [Ictidomys tridecemlineatus]